MSTRSRASGFGHVDKLPSGRWRARYTGPDGRRRSTSFTTKADARAWLATAQADVVRKAWRAPEAGRRTLGAYAADYVARSDLRESTRGLYASLWRHHLASTWEIVAVADVTPQRVRQWHERATRTTRPTALAQSYRLLRSVLSVAVAETSSRPIPAGSGRPEPRSRLGPRGRSRSPRSRHSRPQSPIATAHWCWCWPSAVSGSARPPRCAGATSPPTAPP